VVHPDPHAQHPVRSLNRVLPPRPFAEHVPVVVIGAGAAGLCAALAAGPEALVLERDALPRGSTALSAGLIPAAGTRWQQAAGIADDAAIFAADIQRKAHGQADAAQVSLVAEQAAPTLHWLADAHGLGFSVVDDFDYPGHARRRMHGLPSRAGAELMDRLRAAHENVGGLILTEAHADTLFADADGRIRGVGYTRPDGSAEAVGCDALVLGCSGYGGNPALVAQHIPELSGAIYFGHTGNQGDALLWGQALGAAAADLAGHQGHGSVAHPAGILVSWAVIMEGGVQVNALGERFWNETQGYSEAAASVLAQPGGIAWDIFDERIAGIARQFEDFRQAETIGAVLSAPDIGALAAATGLPADALARALAQAPCPFGRVWGAPLSPPYRAVRVTGALFHTQGGLEIDATARVRRAGGGVLPNLFAAGGAARGVSGHEARGYLSGNGLLTATVLGRIAGLSAAALAAYPAAP